MYYTEVIPNSLFIIVFLGQYNLFQVYNTFESQITSLSPVHYNQIPINIGNGYDQFTNTFHPPGSGLYWFHFDIYPDQSGKVDYTLLDSTTRISTSIYTNKNPTSVVSQTDLRTLQPQSRLHMSSQHPSYVWEDGMHDMTWGGFNIDVISTNPPIAFHVTQTYKLTTKNVGLRYRYPFDVVLVNSGHCWDSNKYTFIAVVGGVYIFSYSSSTTSQNIDLNMEIFNSSSKEVVKIPLCSKMTAGDAIYYVSGSAVAMLNEGDLAYIAKEENEFSLNEFNTDRTSFKGFLYAPPYNIFVAWCAQGIGLSNSAVFDKHDFMNFGSAFNKKTKKVTIPIGGIYYITFQAKLSNIYNSEIVLEVDQKQQIEIKLKQTFFPRELSTTGRSFQLRLHKGNSLSLKIQPLLPQTQASLLFAGFLIAPL